MWALNEYNKCNRVDVTVKYTASEIIAYGKVVAIIYNINQSPQ